MSKPRVLVAIPIKPEMHPYLKKNAIEHASELVLGNPKFDVVLHFDFTEIPKVPTDVRPWSKVARIRNKIVDSVKWDTYDYVLWIDADVVEYPKDILTQLIEANPTGICSPLVLIEKTELWYDWAAFVMKGCATIHPTNRTRMWGRNLAHPPPYWWIKGGEGADANPFKPPPKGEALDFKGETIIDVDCVGTMYVMTSDILRSGARFEDHLAFTDHFPICDAALKMGKRVTVNRNVSCFHAVLPNYGEQWHAIPFILTALALIGSMMA